jgi:Rps23 Pro-64 3,4-dihydroxylase Tpa1-like proline 4-hydroxylase
MNLHQFKNTVLDLGLVYYENVIQDPQKVIDTVNELDTFYKDNPGRDIAQNPWTPWKNDSAGTNEVFCWQKFINQPQNIDQQDPQYEKQLFISETLFGAIDRVMNHYSKELYPFAEKNLKSREKFMHLLRYDKDGYLPAHQDQGISTRVLSVLIYLNDDYEGGEIEFPHSNVKIKPTAGSVIFFPSNFLYVHTVHPLVSGQRYALPNWYHNVPFDKKRDSTGAE